MVDEGDPRYTRMTGEVRIAVDGLDVDAESLWDWLRNEPELRGRLRTSAAPVPEQAMGASIELVVVLATATPAVASVLARSLSTWLVQRRSDLTIKITGPDGRQVTMSGRRVADPEKLMRTVLDSVAPEPLDGSVSSKTSSESDSARER